eukprot:1073132-Ditylum_brightwellii.AAC.1
MTQNWVTLCALTSTVMDHSVLPRAYVPTHSKWVVFVIFFQTISQNFGLATLMTMQTLSREGNAQLAPLAMKKSEY